MDWNVPPSGQREPHHLACMLICIRAWHPINGVSLRDASPKRPLAAQGECPLPLGDLGFFCQQNSP